MFKYLIFGLIAFGLTTIVNQHNKMETMSHQLSYLKGFEPEETELVLLKDSKPFKYSAKDVECLAKNIFFEAGTEDIFGKYAVAQVTINRAKQGYWGKDICKVVYAKNQFSWTDEKDLTTAKLEGPNWVESTLVAKAILSQGLRIKELNHALFYHADYVNPPWIDSDKKIGRIGKHIFYTGGKDSWLSL
jgi:spore germination cell wall hydrolase CwlJ-like protein